MIDKLLSWLDEHPGPCILACLVWLVTIAIIGGFVYHTIITTAAINAGLVEKQKIGYSGTLWSKPD